MSKSLFWIDLETNNNLIQTNYILEIFVQYSDWYNITANDFNHVFWAFVLPEETILLFENSLNNIVTYEQFIASLKLSNWCVGTFNKNGLIKQLWQRANLLRKKIRKCMSSQSVEQRLINFMFKECNHNKPFVFAGKNLHYDMAVLSRLFPLLFESNRLAKHTYDVATLYFINELKFCGYTCFEPAENSQDHRAAYDVWKTRHMNKQLVDSLVTKV